MNPDVLVIAAAVMKSKIDATDKATRADITAGMRAGDRRSVWVETPGGEVEVGLITKTRPAPPKMVRRVVDAAAFLEWVRETRPDEIVTVEHVRESFEQVVLNRPEADDNGEVIDNPPGVEWKLTGGEPVIQVRPNESAGMAIAAAIAAGTVSLADLLALPGGKS